MKKVFFVVLILLLLPAQAFAATVIPSNTYYVSFLDQYRMDYQKISAASYQLYFVSPSSEVFTGNYNFAPTGIHYLTCNGKYKLNFFDASGGLIASTAETVTTAIVSPTCTSYADGINGADDLNAKATKTGDKYQLNWGSLPNAAAYQIWKDGNQVATTTDTKYETEKGSISVVAVDSSGNVLGRSDLNVPKGNSDCCQWLSELLECPDWDKFMGELTQAIKNALPPPPDWDVIADKIGAATVQHLQNYFGPVPEAPTQTEIDSKLNTALPEVNAASPEAASLVPTVPAGYETPKPFDITSGPQIEIVDESVPFQIFDPLHNLQYDLPGVPVIPGDPRNNTGGITKPGTIVTDSPKPTKTIPTETSDPVPKPTPTISEIPIPGVTTGPVPKPK